MRLRILTQSAMQADADIYKLGLWDFYILLARYCKPGIARLHSISAIFTGIVMLTGCSTQTQVWSYQPNSYQALGNEERKIAVVHTFEDKREGPNNNMLFLALIPLVPYGWGDEKRPELDFKPVYDFADGLVLELKARGWYKEIHLSDKADGANYEFRGEVLSTEVQFTLITYGLSFQGGLFWILGLPESIVDRDLSLRLSCNEVKTSNTVFEQTYTAERYHDVSGLYYPPRKPNYSGMLREIYGKFIADLESSGKCH